MLKSQWHATKHTEYLKTNNSSNFAIPYSTTINESTRHTTVQSWKLFPESTKHIAVLSETIVCFDLISDGFHCLHDHCSADSMWTF